MVTESARIPTALLLTCLCMTAQAAMYRWVDENGGTVYSQTPPPSGNAVKLKKEPSPSAANITRAQERMRMQREQAFDEAEAKKEAEAQQTEQASIQERRTQNCAVARGNLEKLRNLGPRRIATPDGRYLRLSEDEVQTQIEKAQEQVKTYCN